MSKHEFNKDFATVYTDHRGQHKVLLPNKVSLPAILETMTVDKVGEHANVTVTFLCNITRNEDEAIEKYNKN